MRDWLRRYRFPVLWTGGLLVALIGTVVVSERCEAEKTKHAMTARIKKLELDHAKLKRRLRRCRPPEKPGGAK